VIIQLTRLAVQNRLAGKIFIYAKIQKENYMEFVFYFFYI